MALVESECIDDEMLLHFEEEFIGKYEQMNATDISRFYYCFTKAGFKGQGKFYKYLQKATTKLMRNFEGSALRLMFYKFD